MKLGGFTARKRREEEEEEEGEESLLGTRGKGKFGFFKLFIPPTLAAQSPAVVVYGDLSPLTKVSPCCCRAVVL